MTSHDVVARVRKIVRERRVGHTGTLDPFATGVLVVLVGRATRLAQFLSRAKKEYEAVIRLGYATDTGDMTGQPIETEFQARAQIPQSMRKQEIETAINSLSGEIEQLPPMYSAKKIGGRKLYQHARRGEEIERQPLRVTIQEFELLSDDGTFLRMNEDGSADLRVRVVCSAGTYVRTLAEDLGKRVGIGAHLTELRRTRAGRFSTENAITLEELAELMTTGSLEKALISPNDALSHLPQIDLDDEQTRRTVHGIDLQINLNDERSWNDDDSIRMTRQGELIAIGTFDANRTTIHPTVVIGD